MKKYEVPIIKDKNQKVLKELSKHIQPFILRRLKKDVIKELPPKIEHKVIVEMTEEQKKVYASYLTNTKREIEREINENGFNKSKFSILSLLTRLRQICCNPSSFIENFDGKSGKILALHDILEESINNNHRILIFSQFTTVLKAIGKMLKNDKIKYMYLDGQTNIKDRTDIVMNFNNGVGDVFLISLKAGGTGLNLTGADVVIHFDPWWNPAVEEQASDRVHRIGQKKSVEVIKLIARGTIEEKIYDLQEKKKKIINDVINDKNSDKNILSKITEDELRDILA
ncbi:DEAD/DEAH box helicase [Clostridium sp. DMHC 10]|uniref:DEAD/DEAH box helicase n=1 Tax=Clostridium sp. DMHC 10 TaxID=747377 RepID=UPI001FA71CAC|nr:DEAD/DEAH box helicase [Clostridium sp. DMHC 10]